MPEPTITQEEVEKLEALEKAALALSPLPGETNAQNLCRVLRAESEFRTAIVKNGFRLLSTLREQQKIIDRLPKTVDGVPIVSGMKLWCCPWGIKPENGYEVTASRPSHSGMSAPDHDGGDATDCYSSRDAALAAANPESKKDVKP